MEKYLHRTYPIIEELLGEKQSILVLGPRATGKTFFLSRILKNKPHSLQINLLNNAEFERFVATPERLYSEIEKKLEHIAGPLFVMIDEIQRIPNLLNEVHRTIEDKKGEVVFILTGSSARKLRRDKNSNLLAGRAISIHFFPLASDEIDLQKDIEKVLAFGTLPEMYLLRSEGVIIEKLKTYVGTYLSEEIQRESEIRRVDKFHRFLEISASLNGSPINYTKVARAIGVSAPTVKEYFSILQDTLVAYQVPAWTFSIKKQLQQAVKYYYFDNGVLNAILGEVSSRPKPSTFHYGKLFENLVVTEFFRLREKRRLSVKIFNYRTKSNQEVDLILQRKADTPIVAIEIKSGSHPSIQDVSSLLHFQQDYPEATCLVLCTTPRAYADGGVSFLPFIEGIEKALAVAESS